MRFDPPPISPPAELEWLLEAAFAPALPPLDGDPAVVADLARRFDLGPRLVARHGAAALQRCLGSDSAESIRSHRRGIAVALVTDRAARQVAALAAGHELPVLFLKGYALEQMLAGPAGWRPYLDLDVMLERPQAERLRELLLAAGWTTSAEAGNPQHLAPLTSPEGAQMDIHYRLRGVRVAAARWATVRELIRAKLCVPADLGATSWLPTPVLMAAHLAVHALEQHGHRPATYPLLRAAADLADLAEAHSAEQLERGTAALIGDSLAGNETRAIFRLAERLAARRPTVDRQGAGDGSETLLRHIVAGALEPAYRESLRLDHTAGRLREARREGRLMRYIALKLKVPAASPQGPARWHHKLTRPLSPVIRLATAVAARLRRVIHR